MIIVTYIKQATRTLNNKGQKVLMGRSKLEQQLFFHKCTVDGTALRQYLPYYVLGKQRWLIQRERDFFYNAVAGYISTITKKFFKQPQGKYTLKRHADVVKYHNERVLLFFEHLPKYSEWFEKRHNAAVVLSTYQREFQYYEAILQLRRLGVALDLDLPVWQVAKSPAILLWCNYFAWKRSGIKDYFDWLWYAKQKQPSPKAEIQIAKDIQHLENVVVASSGAVHYNLKGFTYYARALNEKTMGDCGC